MVARTGLTDPAHPGTFLTPGLFRALAKTDLITR